MEKLSPLKEISLEIRRTRKVLGMTQKKLAARAGVSQAALARIEKSPEEYNPSYFTIWKLLEALRNELIKNQPKNIESRTIKEIMHKKIVSIKPSESFQKALQLMKGKSFSQLPVVDKKGSVLGTIYQSQIADIVLEGKNPKDISAREIMGPALPQIDKNTSLAKAKTILEQWPAILVTENQKVIGIVTSYDWFKAI